MLNMYINITKYQWFELINVDQTSKYDYKKSEPLKEKIIGFDNILAMLLFNISNEISK